MNTKILNQTFEEHKLDVILSTSYQTRLWYSKINTTDGFLFIEKSNLSSLFLDGRYIEMGRKNAKNVNIIDLNEDNIKKFLKDKKYKVVGLEENYLTLAEKNSWKKLLPEAKFININAQKLRILKSKEEIENIQKACNISLMALEKVKHLIKPGVVEKDIDAELDKQMKLLGGEKSAFDTIVVSGTRTSLPHGNPTSKKLQNNEFVTIDFGAIYKGYCADITRTFHVGQVTNAKLLEIENILREAQKLGIKAVKPGMYTCEIDSICRDYIKKHKYDKYFVHSTGHGLGIDVHELPYVSKVEKTSQKLEPGMVITVEPGIYIPGLGGIRVEDDILVTETGYKVLSTLENV